MTTMKIRFADGVAVEVEFGGFTIRTDQPTEDGGTNSAPSPYMLFVASLGACAGFYVLRFCQTRGIDSNGVSLSVDFDQSPDTHRLTRVRIEIHLPPGFPEKYRASVVRAADSCTVRKTLLEPPPIEVVTV